MFCVVCVVGVACFVLCMLDVLSFLCGVLLCFVWLMCVFACVMACDGV